MTPPIFSFPFAFASPPFTGGSTSGLLGLLRQEAGVPEMLTLFVPWILIFGIFYFIAIRPARLKQQQLAKQIDELKKGDRVITTGGIYAEVVGVSDRALVLKIADDVKIRILKSGIAGLDGESDGSK